MFDSPNSLRNADMRDLRIVDDPELKGQVLGLLDTLDEEFIEFRAGRVYDRKGYPSFGPVSNQLDSSSYRRSDESLVLTVTVVVPQWESADVRELTDDLSVYEEEQHAAAVEAKLAAKLKEADEAAAHAEKLRAEAEALRDSAEKRKAGTGSAATK